MHLTLNFHHVRLPNKTQQLWIISYEYHSFGLSPPPHIRLTLPFCRKELAISRSAPSPLGPLPLGRAPAYREDPVRQVFPKSCHCQIYHFGSECENVTCDKWQEMLNPPTHSEGCIWNTISSLWRTPRPRVKDAKEVWVSKECSLDCLHWSHQKCIPDLGPAMLQTYSTLCYLYGPTKS